MSELEERLNAVLSNPEEMSRIAAVAQKLMGELPSESAAAPSAPEAAGGGLLGRLSVVCGGSGFFFLLFLLLGSRLLGGLCVLHGKHLLQRINLVLLGHIVQQDIQLLIAENLGIGLGFFKEFSQHFRNFLGAQTQVGSDFLQTNLHNTHILTHLHKYTKHTHNGNPRWISSFK